MRSVYVPYHLQWTGIVNTSAETVQAVNKWTLEVLVHGLVCLHYVGLVFGRLCLVGNCAEPLGKVSFCLQQLQFIGTSRCGF